MRAVMGWPLGETSLTSKCAIMLNLLGEAEGDEGVRRAHEVMAKAYTLKGTNVHWYGKEGMSKGRKVRREWEWGEGRWEGGEGRERG